MVNKTLSIDDVVAVRGKDGSEYIGIIIEVSATHIMDDIWYCIEPLDEEQSGDETNHSWVYHDKVEKILFE